MRIETNNPILDGIEVQHVTAYLGSSGWKRRADFPRPEVLVFEGPRDDSGEPIDAVIPSSTRMGDFRARLADLLHALSILEERSAYDVARDMLNPCVDLVRKRGISDWPDESIEREMRGTIVKLDKTDTVYGDDDDGEIDESRVAMLRFVEQGRWQHARISLAPEEYRIACDAHRDGKEVVVVGRPERTGKQWRISGIREFRTMDGSTEMERERMRKGGIV